MDSVDLIAKLKLEHEEIYSQLDFLLNELTKVKNIRDDKHLTKTCEKLLNYVDALLNEHFKEEEESIFPKFKSQNPDLIERLVKDHQEIETKFKEVSNKFTIFSKSERQSEIDYKQELLFPSYNLIATINHHAQREDRELFQ